MITHLEPDILECEVRCQIVQSLERAGTEAVCLVCDARQRREAGESMNASVRGISQERILDPSLSFNKGDLVLWHVGP